MRRLTLWSCTHSGSMNKSPNVTGFDLEPMRIPPIMSPCLRRLCNDTHWCLVDRMITKITCSIETEAIGPSHEVRW